jgi:hypothetical protein
MIVSAGAIAAVLFKNENETTGPSLYILVLIAGMVAGGASIFNTGVIKEARLRTQTYKQYCQSAHVTVNKTVSGVREVFFDGGAICDGYLNGGLPLACERPVYDKTTAPEEKIQRESGREKRIVERISEPKSEYEVVVRTVTTEQDGLLKIGGAEKTIRNRVTGEVLAVARRYSEMSQHYPYPSCPSAGFDHLEIYVLGIGSKETQEIVASGIERARYEQGARKRGEM